MISTVYIFSMGFFNYAGQKGAINYLYSQVIFIIISITTILSIHMIEDNKICYRLLNLIFVVSFFACLLLPFLPASLVVETKGARRWIRAVVFSIAPLEFFKIAFIYIIAFTYARKIEKAKRSFKEDMFLLAPSWVLYGVCFAYIYITQNDLGQCVVVAITMLIIALAAGIRFMHILYLFVAVIVAGVGLILSNTRRLERIGAWWGGVQDFILPIFPESIQESLRIAHASEPYQISHSLNAITHGELTGQGLGLGVFKLGFLSEVHTDFILAGISEEQGILGLILICILYLILIISLLKLSFMVKSKRAYLFIVGYASCLIVSFLMNLGGISSLIPLKGIAVPFISYGGSSMLANSIAIGIILTLFKNYGEQNQLELNR